MSDTRNDQPSLALTEFVPTSGTVLGTGDAGVDPGGIPLGSLLIFAGNFTIGGDPLANGALLSTGGHAALFSVVGVDFGGNGATNFALPNLQGIAAVGISAAHGIGSGYGTDAVAPTLANMPAAVGGGGHSLDNDQPSLPVQYIINTGGTGTGSDLPGMVVLFLGDRVPDGFMVAAGQTLNQADFPALFAAIGTTYGSAGAGTFDLPDLKGRAVIGASAADPAGTVAGSDDATIAAANLPSPYGAGDAIDNGQPTLALNYIIATQGIFPDRNAVGGADAGTVYLGEVVAYAGTTAPAGWALADGQPLQISLNAALFSVIGVSYGGDGIHTFDLPNLDGRIVLGTGTSSYAGLDSGTATFSLTTADLSDVPALTVAATAAVSEQTPVVLDPAATLADPALDGIGAGGDYTGATLGVTDSGGVSADDAFSIENGAAFTVQGASLETTGGQVFGTFSTANHQLQITFGGAATPTTALVNDVLDHIVYENLSDVPPASVGLAFAYQGTLGTDAADQTVAITAVDDAPAVTVPAAQATDEDTPLTLDAADGRAVTITDPDSASVTVTLDVQHGELSIGHHTGVDVSTGPGPAAELVMTGAPADVTAALDTLLYIPAAHSSGTDSLSITADDGQRQSSTALPLTINNTGPLTMTTTIDPVAGDGTVNENERDLSGFTVTGSTDEQGSDILVELKDGNGDVVAQSLVPLDPVTGQWTASFLPDALTALQDTTAATASVELVDGLGRILDSHSISFAVDTTPPTIASFTTSDATPTNAQTVTYTLAFSEAMAAPTLSEFGVVTTGGVTGAAVTGVTESLDHKTFTVTVDTGTGDGTVALALASHGPTDAAGNPLGGGSFQPQTTETVGSRPFSVALGDVNGDGKLDMVVANGNATGTVSVLLGDGAGGFGAAAPFTVGSVPFAVALGDVNGDGKLDVVAANEGSSNVSVLLGDGTGGFATAVNYAVGSVPVSVALGDVNGDGKLDIVTANDTASGTVSVLLGDGAGGFAAAAPLAVGSFPDAVALGDVNGDGKLDIVTANEGSGNVSVLLGDGAGGFAAAVNHGVGSLPDAVALGDVNGDGDLDIVAASDGSASVGVLLGDGQGNFASSGNFPVNVPHSVALGDVNGDGKLDIIAADAYDNNAVVLLGNGHGSFTRAASPGVDTDPYSVALGDLDGDGRPDIVTANYNGDDVSVVLNGAPEVTGPAITIDKTAPAAPGIVRVTDNAGSIVGTLADGARTDDPDLGVRVKFGAGLYAGDTVQLYEGTGTSDLLATHTLTAGDIAHGFATVQTGILAPGSHDLTARLTDQAGNQSAVSTDFHVTEVQDASAPTIAVGTPDLVTANDDDSVTVLHGDGTGAFTVGTSTYDEAPSAIAVGDINGDGRPDFVTTNYADNAVTLMLGYGDGTFRDDGELPVAGIAGPQSVTLGDVNGDGNLDIIVGNAADNRISVLLSDGQGGFSQASGSPLFATGGAYDTTTSVGAVGLADLNGDGNLDIVATAFNRADGTGGQLVVALGNGDGSFAAPTSLGAVGDGAYALATADLNGDGAPDIVVANEQDNTVSVFLNDGSGGVAAPVAIATDDGTAGYGPESLAIGNLDGQNGLDLVTANDDGTVSVLLNNGSGTGFTRSVLDAGSAESAVTLADVNGDGHLDIVATDYANNTASVFLNDGSGQFTAAPVTSSTISSDGQGHGPVGLVAADFDTTQHFDPGGTVVFDGAHHNAIVVGDADGDSQTVTLAVANGTLTLAQTDGLTFATGDGTADGAMTFTGTVADVNAALAGLVYTPDAGATADYLQITSSDGVQQATSALQIVETPDQAPTVAVGPADIAVAVYSSSAHDGGAILFQGDGHGGFPAVNSVYAGNGYAAYAVVTGDFNGDGFQDIATANADNSVTAFLGDGQGGFGPAVQTANAGSGPMAAGDLDGQGGTDLAVVNYDAGTSYGSVSVLTSNGDGSFAVAATLPVALGPYAGVDGYADSVAVGDVDGDGRADIVLGMKSGGTAPYYGPPEIIVLKQQSTGGFSTNPGDYAVYQLSGAYGESDHTAVAAGDVDGDGAVDLVATTFGTSDDGTVRILHNTGAGFAETDLPTYDAHGHGLDPSDVAVGDLNGDGKLDIVTSNLDGTVSVLTSDPKGTYDGHDLTVYLAGIVPSSVTLADVNGDGELDIVATNYASDDVSVFLNDGTGTFGPATTIAAGSDYHLHVYDTAVGSFDLAQSMVENTPLVFNASHGNAIVIGDGDRDAQTVSLSVQHGTLTLGDDSHVAITHGGEGRASITFTGSVADVTAALDGLVYTPEHDFGGQDALSITADDGLKQTTSTAPITVAFTNPADNAPMVNAPGPQATPEDTVLSLPITVGDADGDAQTVTLGVQHGTLTLATVAGLTFTAGDGTGDQTVTFSGTLADVNAALAGLSYTPSLNFDGADTLAILADDGVKDDAGVVALTITSVNDAPAVAVPATPLTATEQAALDLKGGGLSISDADGSGSSETVTLSVGEGTLHATAGDSNATVAGDGTAALTLTGTVDEINALLGAGGTSTLSYIDGLDAPSASTTLTLTANDGALSGSGIATIDITPVNDAPVVAHAIGGQSVAEDTPWSFAVPADTFSDVDGDALSLSATMADGSALPAWLGFDAVTQTFTGTPPRDFNGNIALKVTASDGSLTASDGFTLHVTPVADAPVVSGPAHLAATEQVALSLVGDGLSVSDADGAGSLESIVFAVGEGTLAATAGDSGVAVTGGGVSVTLTGTVTQLDALLGGSSTGTLSYIDGLDAPSASTTLTATATGAVDHLHGSDSVTIDIAAVNDAPVARDDTVAVREFAGVGGNVVAGDSGGAGRDSDVDGDSLTVIAVAAAGRAGIVGAALAGAHGTLTLAPDGHYAYVADAAAPLVAGATETDAFTYTVSDGHGGTAAATLTVTITGSATGTGGNDDLVGTGGTDTIVGEGGDDTIHAGGGDDLAFGGGGDDVIVGDAGNDDLRGGVGPDRLFGGDGNDVLWGRSGNDALSGGTGDDILHGAGGNDHLGGGAGDDQLTGGSGDDHLAGGSGNDVLSGNSGNDFLSGRSGDDVLAGGDGDDSLFGGAGRDSLAGGSGRDRLDGGAGNDTISGNADNDVIDGGSGHDVLTGGSGRDTFVFDTGLTAHTLERITDFTHGSDRIELSHAVFGALAVGQLAAADLATDGTAHTGDQHVLYNAHNGWLSYDADGSGAGAAIHFATLGHGLHITAADFLVVA